MKSNILELLEETAARVPLRRAFYDDHEALSFASLKERSRRIGSSLAAVTRPRQVVALLLDARSIRNLPAIFGVLYAGCAYAPLDIAMPSQRLHQLLTLMQPAAILADDKGGKALAACPAIQARVLMEQEASQAPADDKRLTEIRAQSGPFDPASVLYTSGSTGVPKGSVQTHWSYLHWTRATIEVYGLTEEIVFGNQSPFFYANSLLEIYPPVALGATVYLLPAGVLAFPRKMLQCLQEQRVTLLCMTPSSFAGVTRSDALTPGCLKTLRWGIMSGEPMPWQVLQVWMQAAPGASWWHFYGSTEMLSVAVGKVDGLNRSEGRLPVGQPFEAVRLVFLDENGKPAPAGEPAELFVSSPWIALGYYRDEQRTAAAWVEDPLGEGWHERFYRAGDIGYRMEDGQLMVLGRRDLQIKHMGYRMELGEVEIALGRVMGVEESCVLYQKEQDRIWCFYSGSLAENQLRQALREKLARYMLPDVLVRLDELPHTSSMKIDRMRLKARMQ